MEQALPEWIYNLTDIGEWLHTGSRRSTQATEPTETLYRNGNSGMGKTKNILFIFSSMTYSPTNWVQALSGINM